jgi:hypothetical protein
MTAEQFDTVTSERRQQTKLLAEAIQAKRADDAKWHRANIARLNRWLKNKKIGN